MKAIVTKYHGPTNTKGSRISASDQDGNRVTISYDHASSHPHRDAARALLQKMNWDGVWHEGSLAHGGYVYVCETGDTVQVDRCPVCDLAFIELSGPSWGCPVHGIRAPKVNR